MVTYLLLKVQEPKNGWLAHATIQKTYMAPCLICRLRNLVKKAVWFLNQISSKYSVEKMFAKLKSSLSATDLVNTSGLASNAQTVNGSASIKKYYRLKSPNTVIVYTLGLNT